MDDGPGAAPAAGSMMSLRGAVFLGIGAMVGAGIFALLGAAGGIAGSAVWVSFLVGGLVSLALGYAMAKFGAAVPSSGGTMAYLMIGFGPGRLVGTAAWMGYLASIVVVGAMVASTFGSYLADVIAGPDAGVGVERAFASALVVAAAGLCVFGPQIVDRSQTAIVMGLLAVFAFFVIAIIPTIDLSLLAPSGYPDLRAIVSGAAVTFFAYLGFGVITFAGGDMRRPERDLPRAVYLALVVAMTLYVGISFSVFGTLTVDQVIGYGPTAIAEAARPTLGDAGFTLMVVAALLATASSVTATLYAAQGLTSALADNGLFPAVFGGGSALGRNGGLIITVAVMLLFVNVLDVGSLATIGSAISLMVFLLVAIAAIKLRQRLSASLPILLGAAGSCMVVLLVFVADLYQYSRQDFWALIGLVVAATLLDGVRRMVAPPATSG